LQVEAGFHGAAAGDSDLHRVRPDDAHHRHIPAGGRPSCTRLPRGLGALWPVRLLAS